MKTHLMFVWTDYLKLPTTMLAAAILLILVVGVPLVSFFGVAHLADTYGAGFIALWFPLFVFWAKVFDFFG